MGGRTHQPWRNAYLAAALLLLGMAAAADAATYYVSPVGNDASAGTEAQPWRTFDRAWTTVARGDTLVLLDGVYYQTLAPTGFGSTDPLNPLYVTIKAKNDGKAIIDGQGLRRAVELHGYRSVSHVIIEGLVARNGSDVLYFIQNHHVIVRRCSGHNVNTDTNSTVFVVWSHHVLLEDCVGSGSGRKMFMIFGNGGDGYNVIRRGFAHWTEWKGRDYCIRWPYGAGFEFYDQPYNIIENSISYARAEVHHFFIKTDNPLTNPKSHDNKFLGNVAIKAGVNPDGSLRDVVNRPTPTGCSTAPGIGTTEKDEGLWFRAGFSFYRGSDLLNTIVQDNLAYGNAAGGFAVYPSLPGSMAGSVFRRNSALSNGVDGPIGINQGGRWGGPGTDMLQEDLQYFSTVQENRIGKVFQSWPGYPDLSTRAFTSHTGGGARLQHRYVDGVLMDGTNGQPSQSLWPWPMEQRIQDELGISVTNLIAGIVPDQVSGGSCTYTVSPAVLTVPAAGGTVDVTVATNSSCAWGSNSAESWATLAPGSGTGSATVTVTVAANDTSSARNATLTLAGQLVTLNQDAGSACTYSVLPTNVSTPAGGGTTNVSVTTDANCTWTANSNASWATLTPIGGTGPGSVVVTTSANSGSAERSAILTIASQTVTVSQAAAAASCSYSVSPSSLSPPASGGTSNVTVTTSSGCSWTAASSATWASLSQDSGSGAGSVAVTVSPNSASTTRNASLTIADRAIAVSQVGAGESSQLAITAVSASPADRVDQFRRLEITFQVTGSVATLMQWPYDPSPPNGIPAGVGISVHAVFTDPDGRQFQQPAFYAQEFLDEVRDGRDWHLPTGNYSWKVRFSPNRAGNWSYKLAAQDRNGSTESSTYSLSVVQSAEKGFVKVSAADPRYFEFDNGSPFVGQGFQSSAHLDDPTTKGAPEYATLGANGIDFVRIWISGMFGSAWNTWIGGRNQYRGYLPITGLMRFDDAASGLATLTMRLDYEPEGDVGWFDACRMQFWDDPESIKPGTTYRIRVQYRGIDITGPRVAGSPNYGLVAKLGGWHPDCYEPGTSAVVTNYGRNNNAWGYVEGTWNSGSNNYLPRLHLALENVTQGEAYIQSVSVREDLGGGNFGPEIIVRSSMEHQLYIPEEHAFAFDKVLSLAEQHGVYLKPVIMEKNDKIYAKMADDGSWATGDNEDGFYGLGRTMNKTRWLQQMWWRYLQARWGYSPNIHSWELTNEGDPFMPAHYQMTDEFGKFMHCRVFGVEPGAGDGARCALEHPNHHLVTTSFWQWFPATEFWGNSKYPNVDYADVHAYVSTSYAPLTERQAMQWDASFFHTWHSTDLAGWNLGKPIVRGEGGLDGVDQQNENVLGLDRDTGGVWLHNLLWSQVASGGLYELYWWGSPHIWNGTVDHRPQYKSVRTFLSDVPLNKGGYNDWGGSVTNAALRVLGQKNTSTGSAVLWVQNRQHTWKNVVDGVSFTAASGDVIVPGFPPTTSYTIERWNTYTPDGQASVQSLSSDAGGNLRITVSALTTDVAFRVWQGPRAPTGVRVTQ